MFEHANFPKHTYAGAPPPPACIDGDIRPNRWTNPSRGQGTSVLDCETAVALACFLAPAFRAAQSWSELLDALERKGFWLGFEYDELMLIQRETGLNLCKCTAIGHTFADLRLKLGKPRVEAGSMRVADNSLCTP